MTLQTVDEVVCVDFEFISSDGEHPRPVCFVARELKSGKVYRQWVETEAPAEPPFAHGPNTLVVAYYNAAEMSCYLALGWPLPRLTADLYVLFREATNGLLLPHGRGLLGALRWFGHDSVDVLYKDAMQKRVLQGPPYSADEQNAILNYCQSDVDALLVLLPHLIGPATELTLPVIRAEFMKCLAEIEWRGIPVNSALYGSMVEHWPELRAKAIDRINRVIPVYERGSFRSALFEAWLEGRDWLRNWPRTPGGCLSLDEETFDQQSAIHPELIPLHQTRQMLGQMKQPGLAVGADGRNRCMLSGYSTVTSRCAPSTAKYIFGAPSWARSLIQPEPGKALIYADWSAQEVGIAGVLSGDTALQNAYRSGDPYITFAKVVKAVPDYATDKTHPEIRNLYKQTVLQSQYSITAAGLSRKLNIAPTEAQSLLDQHRQVYSTYWRWNDSVSDYIQLQGELQTMYGWRMLYRDGTNLRTARNFLLQATGSEMLRLACSYAAREHIEVVATIHDALMVEADESDVEDVAMATQQVMQRASETVLQGFALRSEAKKIRHPDYYVDKRGVEMWDWMVQKLTELNGNSSAA